MGKPRPAPAGGSTTPAELLAQAEAALADADLTPEERAAAEEDLDELRQAARAAAEAERMDALAVQEIANHAAVHGLPQDQEPAAAPSAEKPEGGE